MLKRKNPKHKEKGKMPRGRAGAGGAEAEGGRGAKPGCVRWKEAEQEWKTSCRLPGIAAYAASAASGTSVPLFL